MAGAPFIASLLAVIPCCSCPGRAGLSLLFCSPKCTPFGAGLGREAFCSGIQRGLRAVRQVRGTPRSFLSLGSFVRTRLWRHEEGVSRTRDGVHAADVRRPGETRRLFPLYILSLFSDLSLTTAEENETQLWRWA